MGLPVSGIHRENAHFCPTIPGLPLKMVRNPATVLQELLMGWVTPVLDPAKSDQFLGISIWGKRAISVCFCSADAPKRSVSFYFPPEKTNQKGLPENPSSHLFPATLLTSSPQFGQSRWKMKLTGDLGTEPQTNPFEPGKFHRFSRLGFRRSGSSSPEAAPAPECDTKQAVWFQGRPTGNRSLPKTREAHGF